MSYACYKTGDNRHDDCPPRMADGRHFTDFRPNCTINNMLRVQNKVVNSYEYRMFLTRNAEDIMTTNESYAMDKNACKTCDNTMLPEQTKVSCNKESCDILMSDPLGVGQGRANGKLDHCDNCPSELIRRNQTTNDCMKPYDKAQQFSMFKDDSFDHLQRHPSR